MNISQRITKRTDLEINDSLSCFEGHCAQQHHNTYEVFYDFIKEVKPSRILEIGTAMGGFTVFLNTVCKELNLNTTIRTYDIHPRGWYSSIRDLGVDIRVENIFSDNWDSVEESVVEFIKSDGVTIILCDGGWKKGEFNLLSNYLKTGDFILAHDYAHDADIFNSEINKIVWNWHELQYSDIESAVNRNNLNTYRQEVFSKVAWICTQK